MKGFFVTAAFSLAVVVTGCGSAQLFRAHPLADAGDDGADLAWPRLVDTPQAPAPGEYTAAVPDPAEGTAVEVQLGLVADAAGVRAAALAEPVLEEQERRQLGRRR